jgi:hypothetical protein
MRGHRRSPRQAREPKHRLLPYVEEIMRLGFFVSPSEEARHDAPAKAA